MGMKNKGNLLNLLYFLSLPSAPKIQSRIDYFDSLEDIKKLRPALGQEKGPGQYFIFVLRGYSPEDRLVQITLEQSSQQNSYSSHLLVSQAEEEILRLAQQNSLKPEECTLAVKGVLDHAQEQYLCDLIQGKYKSLKTHTEIKNLDACLNLSL